MMFETCPIFGTVKANRTKYPLLKSYINMAAKKGNITWREDHFSRDLGWKKTDGGKLSQHRFHFPRDMNEKTALRTSLLLEQIWEAVEADVRLRNERHAFDPDSERATWTTEGLWIAKAIARGEHHLEVPYFPTMEVWATYPDPPHAAIGAGAYATLLTRLKNQYPFVVFVAGDPNAHNQGKHEHKTFAEDYARKSRLASSVAETPIATGIGDTLYQALDAFADYVLDTRKRGGDITEWGHVLSDNIRRLKRSGNDLPVDQIDVTVVERMVRYWTNRPTAENKEKPITLASVEQQVKALRMFLKWLHKTPAFKWRGYMDVEDALKVDYAGLMTHDEIAGLKHGVFTYTVDELTLLYKYATDRERVLLLLGLNCAFARAECVSLRKDELHWDETPPKIKRVRRKSRIYAEFSLWPQTVQALTWLKKNQISADTAANLFTLITPQGKPLREIGIANAWNKLLDRVTNDNPTFRRLSFKHLRKTAGQLIRNMSDGETAGVFLSHGQPVKSDDLLDAYTNRDFSKVFAALDRVHLQLAPMFAAAPNAFTNAHSPAGANISRSTIESIHKLHAEGKSVSEIARTLNLSRPTVYRWIPTHS
jgi:hypothetical protein